MNIKNILLAITISALVPNTINAGDRSNPIIPIALTAGSALIISVFLTKVYENQRERTPDYCFVNVVNHNNFEQISNQGYSENKDPVLCNNFSDNGGRPAPRRWVLFNNNYRSISYKHTSKPHKNTIPVEQATIIIDTQGSPSIESFKEIAHGFPQSISVNCIHDTFRFGIIQRLEKDAFKSEKEADQLVDNLRCKCVDQKYIELVQAHYKKQQK